MQSNKNKVIVACAGSGKTTFIVEQALKLKDQRILITTYTIENLGQVKEYFIEKAGCIPPNITVQTFFSFLLQEGVRPYQNQMTNQPRVRSIFFQVKRSRYHKKDNYFTSANDIYSNKVSEFVYECNQKTNGQILKRLGKMFDYIFIDELQDFAGYDLDLLGLFFDSKINLVAVGDPRQATYSTNIAQKHRQYRRSKIFSWLEEKKQNNEIDIEVKNESYRCNKPICDFASNIFPELPKMVSKNSCLTGHDGIFYVTRDKVSDYFKTYKPVILRFWKRTNTLDFYAINIGLSKGRTYERVLIFPTKPMLQYLKTKDISEAGDRTKLYIAVTRAKYSAAFVVNDTDLIAKQPPLNNRRKVLDNAR